MLVLLIYALIEPFVALRLSRILYRCGVVLDSDIHTRYNRRHPKGLIKLAVIDFRKNTGQAAPPANGGFAVIRGCALFLAFALTLSAVVGLVPVSMRAPQARAQTAPASSSNTDTMVKDLVTYDSEINGLKTKLTELDSKSASLEARIESVGSKIEARRQRLESKRQALNARVRSIYVNGHTSKLVMLVSAKGVDDYMNRADMMHKMAQKDSQLITETKAEAGALQASMTQLKSDKKEVERVSADLRTRKDRLEKSRSERASLISAAGAKSPQVVAQSTQIETKIKQINPPVTVNGRPSGKVLQMVATAYSPEEPGLDDHTASGMRATRGVVAVDPRVIPLGTRLNVEGYGNCIAGDTGSAIKGNRIDLCFDTLQEMNAYGGYHNVRVEILD